MKRVINFCRAGLPLAAALALVSAPRVCAYTFERVPSNATANAGEIQEWPVGTVSAPTSVQMTLQLQQSPAPAIPDGGTMQDGSTSWNQVAIAALTDWNQYIATLKFSWINNSSSPLPTSSSQHNNNNVFWSGTVYGDSWGSTSADAVGITIIWTQTNYVNNVATTTNVVETDVLFNTNVGWDSYRGSIQGNTTDIRRVALHEFGHVLGLNHPDQATPVQSVKAIMNSVTSATDDLTADDIGGAQYLYGAPNVVAIQTQPASQTAAVGQSVTFSVLVTGYGNIIYQWLKNGLTINGATGSSLTLSNVQSSDAATYSVSVSDGGTPVTSSGGVLTVVPDVAPAFTTSPASQTISTGRSVVFNAVASGVPTPTYQWTLNNSTTIPGAAVTTDPILWVQGATASNAGTYTCTVTNSTGPQSASATLAVVNSGTPGYLTNVSARGLVEPAPGVLIGAFSITGTGNKTLLIRGDGPALVPSPNNLPGAVSDPTLELYSGSTPITINGQPIQNDNWGTPDYPGAANATTLNTAFGAVGAFPLTSGSLDSAILVTLEISGSAGCSGVVSGVGGATGNGLVEVYDDDTDAPAVRLTNVSARDQVGLGNNILIGGFGIAGNTAETLLIRSLGPGLSIQGITTGTLTQPVLTVFNGGTPIYSNSIWGGDQVLVAGMALVGAYALPANSTDAALMITMAPGSYTVEVSGANYTTGIATVEIYEIP